MIKELIKQISERRDYLSDIREKQYQQISEIECEIKTIDTIILALEHNQKINKIFNKKDDE